MGGFFFRGVNGYGFGLSVWPPVMVAVWSLVGMEGLNRGGSETTPLHVRIICRVNLVI